MTFKDLDNTMVNANLVDFKKYQTLQMSDPPDMTSDSTPNVDLTFKTLK